MGFSFRGVWTMEFSFVGQESTECMLLIKPNQLAEKENQWIFKDLHTKITVLNIRRGFNLIFFFFPKFQVLCISIILKTIRDSVPPGMSALRDLHPGSDSITCCLRPYKLQGLNLYSKCFVRSQTTKIQLCNTLRSTTDFRKPAHMQWNRHILQCWDAGLGCS